MQPGGMKDGLIHALVIKLAEPLKNRGHHCYTDNYYTSLALFADLRSNGACGTLVLCLNRQGVPKSIKAPIEKGDTKV